MTDLEWTLLLIFTGLLGAMEPRVVFATVAAVGIVRCGAEILGY